MSPEEIMELVNHLDIADVEKEVEKELQKENL